jgi:hypothetical protein
MRQAWLSGATCQPSVNRPAAVFTRLRLLVRRVVHEVLEDAQDAAVASRGVGDAIQLRKRARRWLLERHVLSGLQGGGRVRLV